MVAEIERRTRKLGDPLCNVVVRPLYQQQQQQQYSRTVCRCETLVAGSLWIRGCKDSQEVFSMEERVDVKLAIKLNHALCWFGAEKLPSVAGHASRKVAPSAAEVTSAIAGVDC